MSSNLMTLCKRVFQLPRSLQQVCIDVDDEIGFHLESRFRSMVNEGVPLESAMNAATECFGQVSEIRAELINIGMRPRRRLVGVCSMLLLSATALSIYFSIESHDQLEHQLVLHSELSDQLELTRLSAHVNNELSPAQAVRLFSIEGAITYPRLWAINRSRSLTLTQLIGKSGGLTEHATGRVFILPRQSGAFESVILDYSAVISGLVPDPYLSQSCTIMVETINDPKPLTKT